MKFSKVVWRILCSLLLLFTSGWTARAYRANNQPVLFAGTFEEWLNKRQSAPADSFGVLLHARHILNTSEWQHSATEGVQLKEYLGDSVYSAFVAASLQSMPALFDGIASLNSGLKLDASLRNKIPEDSVLRLWFSFYPSITGDAIKSWAERAGLQIYPQKWEQRNVYEIGIKASALLEASEWYGVQWVQPVAVIRALDQDSKAAIGTTLASAPVYAGGWGLSGNGVTIGHGDNCSGIYHIDQRDRVINHNYGYKTNHGVLVNGLMGGQGIMDPAGRGVATGSRFISAYFDDILLLKTPFYNRYNLTLTNNSYRADRTDLCSYSGVYDVLSANLDRMAQENPAQLDVFAASNDGATTCSPYPAGYFTISGGYQTAKNVLTIGSCTRELQLANSSSRGPVKDGRLKPEVISPGQNIYCPIPDNTYMFESGTSLACPQATGLLALLTERYRQVRSGSPPGALLKAIAINGATDIGRKGPDFWYGFGLLSAARSLSIIDSNRMYEDVISSTSVPVSVNIHVPSAAAQLKILLYYHDTAASLTAGNQLVNDLDLTVTDLAGTVHRPLVPDPDPLNVAELAAERADHRNNVEQVVIDNPSAGDYKAVVSPYAVPVGEQRFYLVYDIVPSEIRLQYPVSGVAAAASSDMYIYWSGTGDTSVPVSIEFSADGGGSWTTLATLVTATRVYKWSVPAINSGHCKVRITQGALKDESGLFTINRQPVLSLAADQCPGSVALQWTLVPNALRYCVLQKIGADFAVADTVDASDTTYTFNGLRPDSEYCFSVFPLINGQSGYRAKALLRRPASGNCLSAAPGDLMIEAIAAPVSGRRYTSTGFSAATWLKARIRNMDKVPHNYRVRYNINGTGWRVTDGFSISAGVSNVQDIDTVDMSAIGSYSIVMTVQDKDILDPVKANDTAWATVRHIANDTIWLTTPFVEDFEGFSDTMIHTDQIGLDFPGYWDFSNNNDTGRFSSRMPVAAFTGGIGSASMDVLLNKDSVFNAFTGTFNLGAYDTLADEVRLDFNYVLRGNPLNADSNKVWVRGSDRDIWLPAFAYREGDGLQSSGTISLRDVFRRNAQNFSSSTQIRFSQSDTTLIADDKGAGGLSIDNVRLYKVQKELRLVSILNPDPELCSQASQVLRIRLRNGTPNPAASVQVGYILDKGSVVSEELPGGIGGDDSLDYAFKSLLSSLKQGFHELKVWVSMPGDDHPENDTLFLRFHVSSSVDAYPSLQQFESPDSSWYVDGGNASWVLGAPHSGSISSAASGVMAWKTNPRGTYNISEHSFLISPCLNTISMSQPMLSLSMAFQLEDCVPDPCDYLFAEYSVDQGRTWKLLGKKGAGTNWYNRYGDYWSGSWLRWHAASVELPRSSWLKIRFVLVTDKAKVMEGVAIDDIHIYDLAGRTAPVTQLQSITTLPQTVAPDSWVPLLADTFIVAQVNSKVSVQSDASVFRQDVLVDEVHRQYTAPISWRLSSEPVQTNTGMLRLYLEDSVLIPLWADSSCKDCTRPPDIYRMGVTRFDQPGNNDSLLSNNGSAVVNYLKYAEVNWIPYDKGYYAAFTTIPGGEFWLNDGGLTGTVPLNTDYINLSASRYGKYSAVSDWICPLDPDIAQYTLERSFDGMKYVQVHQQPSAGVIHYQWIDDVFLRNGDSVYYRVLCATKSGKSFYSDVRVVRWEDPKGIISVYPIPSPDGTVNIRWEAPAGTPLSVKVFDMAGRLVKVQELVADKWVSERQLSLRGLPAATYILDLELNEQHDRRLIRQQ